jgi:hypothetical protein
MTKVTAGHWTDTRGAMRACSITRRLNNLHLIVCKNSPKDLSFPS